MMRKGQKLCNWILSHGNYTNETVHAKLFNMSDKEFNEAIKTELDIRKMPIYELVCDECKKPINKNRRIGGSCVLISQSMAGTKLLCPEHIMDDEKKRLCGLFKEKVIEIAKKKKSKPLDLLKAIKEIETEEW
jgi:hypothetical protein